MAYPLSYRNLEEMAEERGYHVDHSTLNRWVINYAPELEKEFHKKKRPVNGKEFTLHEILAKELDCNTYFAKPYHSWERGQNENANGLLRQYFPKQWSCLISQ